jgi:uncharacterized membrane protein YhaH (DUF805 family)
MGFGAAVRRCLSNYSGFSGRAGRPEYWYFFLFLLLGGIAFSLLDQLLFGRSATVTGPSGSVTVAGGPRPLSSVFSLATLIPHLAVAWRRMHDTGRSGYFVLLPMALMLAMLLVLLFGIGLADHFASGGSMDILFTRVTLAVTVPVLIVLLLSPLLVLWWLSRPGEPGPNRFGAPHAA